MIGGYHLSRIKAFEHRLEGEFLVKIAAYGRALRDDRNLFGVEEHRPGWVAETDRPPVAAASPYVESFFQVAGHDP